MRSSTSASKVYDRFSKKERKTTGLVAQVVGVAHTFVEVWEGVAALLAEMDVLLGFAEVAVNAPTPYVRPQMLPPDDGELKLVGCRSVSRIAKNKIRLRH